MPSRRGRPSKGNISLDREAILAAALRRLDVHGAQMLSLRSLAADLGVTPMALYFHVAGLDDILDELSAGLFEPATAASDEDLPSLEGHLSFYCDRVLKHPGLTQAIVFRRGRLPPPHADWTSRLRELVVRERLAKEWADILVDHLHGFAIPHASAGSPLESTLRDYRSMIEIVLAAARRVGGSTAGDVQDVPT